jgi:hypothetical protein
MIDLSLPRLFQCLRKFFRCWSLPRDTILVSFRESFIISVIISWSVFGLLGEFISSWDERTRHRQLQVSSSSSRRSVQCCCYGNCRSVCSGATPQVEGHLIRLVDHIISFQVGKDRNRSNHCDFFFSRGTFRCTRIQGVDETDEAARWSFGCSCSYYSRSVKLK